MTWVKGQSGNPGGRPVGLKDKASEIRLSFYEAFNKTGGIVGLIKWVNKDNSNKKEFYKLLLQLLPKEFAKEGLETLIPETKIVVVYADGTKVQPRLVLENNDRT